MSIKVKRLTLGALRTNTYVVERDGHALVIDPTDDTERILNRLQGLSVDGILLTHGHLDHFYKSDVIAEMTGAEIFISKKDYPFLKDVSLSAPAGTFGAEEREYTVLPTLSEGRTEIGTFSFEVIETGGHTPGSLCFIIDGVLFSGDTLFRGTCGRVDCPLSSAEEMKRSLSRLLTLPPDTLVYPGHGPTTTVAAEKETLFLL